MQWLGTRSSSPYMSQSCFKVALLVASIAALASCQRNADQKPAVSAPTTASASPANDPAAAKPNNTTLCTAGGNASVTGIVGESDFSKLTSAWFFEPMPGLVGIAMQEAGNSCGEGESPTVALILCGREAKTYSVIATPQSGPNCNGAPNTAFVVAEARDGIDFGSGTGGTVTIEVGDTDCLAGTFAVEIDSQPVTGTFEATFCRDMKSSTN